MSTYSEGFELFLKGYSGDLGSDLAGKIIEQWNGEEAFLGSYEKVCESGMIWAINGWIQTTVLATFFENNRKLFMDFMKASIHRTEHKSIAELVATFADVKKVYSIDEITEALSNSDSEQYQFVAAAIGRYSSEVLSKCYVAFLEYHPDGSPSYSTALEHEGA